MVFSDDHVTRIAISRILRERGAFEAIGATQCGDIAVPPPKLWNRGSFSLSTFQYDALFTHQSDVDVISGEKVSSESTIESSYSPEENDMIQRTIAKKRAELLGALLQKGVVLLRGVPCVAGEILRTTEKLVGFTR